MLKRSYKKKKHTEKYHLTPYLPPQLGSANHSHWLGLVFFFFKYKRPCVIMVFFNCTECQLHPVQFEFSAIQRWFVLDSPVASFKWAWLLCRLTLLHTVVSLSKAGGSVLEDSALPHPDSQECEVLAASHAAHTGDRTYLLVFPCALP